mmetsp:Transcript_12577/g.22849  ORF Transcript_12577/g.22849 Transcript_12577/m.22849 type:complete len:92 (-) Transcript_12577:132-407(-)
MSASVRPALVTTAERFKKDSRTSSKKHARSSRLSIIELLPLLSSSLCRFQDIVWEHAAGSRSKQVWLRRALVTTERFRSKQRQLFGVSFNM